MNSQSIKTFITLAKLNSFSQTATSLYISQSTVTKRICELEKEVGKPLFYRDKKHVSLTEDGRIFLKYATRIVELEEASLKEMHSSVTYENSLRIGSTNSIYECHLFPLISGFESASKKHSVKVTIGHSSDMIQLLMDGILDCALHQSRWYAQALNVTIFTRTILCLRPVMIICCMRTVSEKKN